LTGGLSSPDGMVGSDRVRLARLQYWMGRIHYLGNALPEAISYFSQVLPVAQEIGDPELLAIPSSAIGAALMAQGRLGEAEPLLRQAMTALEQVGNVSEWVQALAFHSTAMAMMGDYALGMAGLQRALTRAQEKGSVHLICIIQMLQAAIHVYGGEPLQAVEAARKATEAAEESGDRLYVYLGHGYRAWAEAGTGQFEAAEANMARSQAVARELGGKLHSEDLFLAAHAEIALGARRIQEALNLAEQSVATAQELGSLQSKAVALRVWGQALADLEPPRWNEAGARLAESLRVCQSAPTRVGAARTHVAWGTVCRDRGDLIAAREHWEQAAAMWEASGITWELEKVRALIETLPEG
jgi:tetratricopeptide (TPR) repeat protein